MKKLVLGCFLISALVLGGCSLFGKKNTETVDINAGTGQEGTSGVALVTSVKGKYTFEDDNCNKYVALMECLLDKTPETAKEQTATSFIRVMELWQGLEKSTLPETCKNTMNMLQDQKEVFAKAGCELK